MHVFDTSFTQNFDLLKMEIRDKFLDEGIAVADARSWQGVDISNRSEMTPVELRHVVLEFEMPQSVDRAQAMYEPNMPWAEEHFAERVSGRPYNPPPSHERWPHRQNDNEEFQKGKKFSHTYPERFWPKFAGFQGSPESISDQGWAEFIEEWGYDFKEGIRYPYGDLQDVVDQLRRDPYTRQAYLPVWFPEDTGAVCGQRVPCTLGYHFLFRNGSLDVTYHIRSCDFRRHFADDVYLAARLAQYVKGRMSDVLEEAYGSAARVGKLIMHIGSFHVFSGDLEFMRSQRVRENKAHEIRFQQERSIKLLGTF